MKYHFHVSQISAEFGNDDFGASTIADGFRPSRPENDDGSQRATVCSHSSTNTLVDESLASPPPPPPLTGAGLASELGIEEERGGEKKWKRVGGLKEG